MRDRVGVIADGYLYIEVVQPPERGHLEPAVQVDDIIIAKRLHIGMGRALDDVHPEPAVVHGYHVEVERTVG